MKYNNCRKGKKFKMNVHNTEAKIQCNEDVMANFFKAPDIIYVA
jgi:hypothetical protein